MTVENIPVNTDYSQRSFACVTSWAQTGCMKNLRAIRISAGLSQVQLAEKAGVTQSLVSKIEKGQANPTLDVIEAIAGALGTSPAVVFGLPELQQRAVRAIENIDPEIQQSALTVLEKMAAK